MKITADLIVQYRASHELNSRVWQDQSVQRHAVSLSRQLTIAKMAGWEDTVTDITALLVFCEPLHERSPQSYQGFLLQIAFTYYCLHDVPASRVAVQAALICFPDDARLRRLEIQLTELFERKP